MKRIICNENDFVTSDAKATITQCYPDCDFQNLGGLLFLLGYKKGLCSESCKSG